MNSAYLTGTSGTESNCTDSGANPCLVKINHPCVLTDLMLMANSAFETIKGIPWCNYRSVHYWVILQINIYLFEYKHSKCISLFTLFLIHMYKWN